MTIQEATKRIGKSESTLRRAIKTGLLAVTTLDGKYDISDEAFNNYAKAIQVNIQDDKVVDTIIGQLKEKDKQIEQLNMIIMQLTRQVGEIQKALEKPPPRKSFWDRFRRR